MSKLLSFLVLFFSISFGQPVPRINSINPHSGPVGSIVTISGVNFGKGADSCVVRFGGVTAEVLQADSIKLTVKVPAGAMYAPIAVTVGGLTSQSANPFLPTFVGGKAISSESFFPKIDFSTPSMPSSVALGDLDGNGTLDVVVANDGGGTISIYSNRSVKNKGIAFFSPVIIPISVQTHSLAVTDINGDGRLDIVTVSRGNHTVSILRNVGAADTITASSFAPKIDFPVGDGASFVISGDMDGDGKPDIIVANSGSNTISVYRNTSVQDSIQFSSRIDMVVGNNPFCVAIQDINGDGKPDMAVTNFNSNTVSIFRNKSVAGLLSVSSFAPKIDIATGGGPIGIAVNDIDRDGKADLIVGNHTGNIVSIYKNVSPAFDTIAVSSFASKVDFSAGVHPWSVTMGELNGDDKPDIVMPNWGGSNISVFENNSDSGSISLKPKIDFQMGDSPRGAAIGDLNGDGLSDITAISWTVNTLSIFQNAPLVPVGLDDPLYQNPTTFLLGQNYPNPFNPTTNIQISIPERSHISLEIFNLLGQKIELLVNAEYETGNYTIQWNAKVGSGLYFYRIQAIPLQYGSKVFTNVRSMVLMR